MLSWSADESDALVHARRSLFQNRASRIRETTTSEEATACGQGALVPNLPLEAPSRATAQKENVSHAGKTHFDFYSWHAPRFYPAQFCAQAQ